MKPLQIALVAAVFGGWLIGEGLTQSQPTRPLASQEIRDETTDIQGGLQLESPVECQIGELVRFDARSSNVESMVWAIVPETPDFETVDGDRRAMFSARGPGRYLIMVAGAKSGKAFLVYRELTVKGTIVQTGLAIKISRWASQLPADIDKAKFGQMAGVFRKLATSETPVDKMLEATALANSAVLGDTLEKWIPFLDELGKELDRLVATGELKTREQYSQVWKEIANGLDQVK